jgi:hypothetical protein
MLDIRGYRIWKSQQCSGHFNHCYLFYTLLKKGFTGIRKVGHERLAPQGGKVSRKIFRLQVYALYPDLSLGRWTLDKPFWITFLRRYRLGYIIIITISFICNVKKKDVGYLASPAGSILDFGAGGHGFKSPDAQKLS